jgi:integrase
MSIYKDPRSPYWQFDFQVRGHRFYGSTETGSRREAEKIELKEREKAKRRAEEAEGAASSLRLDDVADRYWLDIGQHHAGEGAANTKRQLARLIGFFGKDKLITEIGSDDIARLVAWRRSHRSARGGLISAFTVNDTTEQVKKLFTRAKVLGVRFAREPRWRDHWLKEPQERVNELKGDQGQRLIAAARDEYQPILALAEATGLRQRECLLRWSEVDWDNERIVKTGKGGKRVVALITSEVRAILWPLRGQHPDFVFTYVAERSRGARVKGERQPITQAGLKTQWRRLVKRAGVAGFRFHDYRHDFGTKLLRQTGNLKLVSRALNHADLKSTMRYAHVADDDIRAALERRAGEKSRTESRNGPEAEAKPLAKQGK